MGLVLHHRVALATTVHLRPGEQRLLLGNVIGKADVDGRPVVVEPSNTVYGKTGAVVCKLLQSLDDVPWSSALRTLATLSSPSTKVLLWEC